MPALSTRPVVAALRAALTGGGLTVIDGGLGDATPPCVVLWAAPGSPTGSLGDPSDSLQVEVATVACGQTADQAMWVADRVAALLDRTVLPVAGRTVHPLHLLRAQPVARDDDGPAPVWFATCSWQVLTTP